MKFTKELVNIIEDKFNVNLSEVNINKGDAILEYENNLSSSKYVVHIKRKSVNSIKILVRFKYDSYYFINGVVDTKGLKRLLKGI